MPLTDAETPGRHRAGACCVLDKVVRAALAVFFGAFAVVFSVMAAVALLVLSFIGLGLTMFAVELVASLFRGS